MTESRRVVRVTLRFFEDLDRQLTSDRGPQGEPSTADFQAFELVEIIDRFATDFYGLPQLIPGRDSYRVLMSTGKLVRAYTVVAQLAFGDKILVTIPIAMLQREAIQFNPPLPADKVAEIHKEEMPGGLKVFIEFAERFYPDFLHVDGILSNIGLDNAGYYNAAIGKASERHVLGLFAQGTKA